MITLPASPAVRHCEVEPIDMGFTQRAANGAGLRIDRPGNRYRMVLEWPPLTYDQARVFEARLERARTAGLRHPVSLVGTGQGLPGAPVVNGSDSGGTTLKVRGCTAGYWFREGYWLNVEVAGVRSLHRVAADVQVGAPGTATLTVEPPLPVFPADGDTVIADAPTIEGECSFERFVHPVNRRVTLSATIEESI